MTPSHHKTYAHDASLPFQVFRKQSSEVDDYTSTAASSVMHSPNRGMADSMDMDMMDLGSVLAELSPTPSLSAAPAEQPRHLQLLWRIEWFLSEENLCHDWYLNSHMTQFGWVRIADVLQLPGLLELEASVEEVATVVQGSGIVQLSGDFRQLRARSAAQSAAQALSMLPQMTEFVDVGEVDFTVHEVDVADEDMTIAASLGPPTISIEQALMTKQTMGAEAPRERKKQPRCQAKQGRRTKAWMSCSSGSA